MLASVDTGNAGDIIGYIVGAGAVGGGSYMVGKAKATTLTNDPLNVKMAEQFATKAELEEVKDDIKELQAETKKSIDKLCDRINPLSETMHEVRGMLRTFTRTDNHQS